VGLPLSNVSVFLQDYCSLGSISLFPSKASFGGWALISFASPSLVPPESVFCWPLPPDLCHRLAFPNDLSSACFSVLSWFFFRGWFFFLFARALLPFGFMLPIRVSHFCSLPFSSRPRELGTLLALKTPRPNGADRQQDSNVLWKFSRDSSSFSPFPSYIGVPQELHSPALAKPFAPVPPQSLPSPPPPPSDRSAETAGELTPFPAVWTGRALSTRVTIEHVCPFPFPSFDEVQGSFFISVAASAHISIF